VLAHLGDVATHEDADDLAEPLTVLAGDASLRFTAAITSSRGATLSIVRKRLSRAIRGAVGVQGVECVTP
jgi:hypothetical protein